MILLKQMCGTSFPHFIDLWYLGSLAVYRIMQDGFEYFSCARYNLFHVFSNNKQWAIKYFPRKDKALLRCNVEQ